MKMLQYHKRTALAFGIVAISIAQVEMVAGKEIEAKFELQEGDEKPVDLVVIKESDLKQSVEQGSVKQYSIYGMKFLKK